MGGVGGGKSLHVRSGLLSAAWGADREGGAERPQQQLQLAHEQPSRRVASQSSRRLTTTPCGRKPTRRARRVD
jgi:hypothetical protein